MDSNMSLSGIVAGTGPLNNKRKGVALRQVVKIKRPAWSRPFVHAVRDGFTYFFFLSFLSVSTAPEDATCRADAWIARHLVS